MPDSTRSQGANCATTSAAKAFPLRRALPELRRQRFDLLVIGGGIYGAWVACDAAQRGLSVALVEARDWAAGTSSASSKLVHGGLRYLENFELGLVRESLTERRTLARIAPHRVRPLRFLLPIWGGSQVTRWKLSAGLFLYDVLAGFKQPVERHHGRSRTQLQTAIPWLAQSGLRGGFEYGDCQEDDARLTLDLVAAAQAAGAACANHVSAETLIETSGRVRGANVRDVETDHRFELHADAVVAATGPWSGKFAARSAAEVELIRGAHLLLPAIPDCRQAIILSAPQDGRAFFVIPWYGRSLVGTTESKVTPDQLDAPDFTQANADERRYLLDALAVRLPGLAWRDADVIGSYAGVRSLRAETDVTLSAVSREFTLLRPSPGLWVPLGGKLTTARKEAEGIVDDVLRALDRDAASCTTAMRALPGAPSEEFAHWRKRQREAVAGRASLDTSTIDSLLGRYGTRIASILELIDDDPTLAERLHPELPFIGAELVLARRDEMARDLDDALRRRLPLTLLARPGPWRNRAKAIWDRWSPSP